jgi:hypothetical protein
MSGNGTSVIRLYAYKVMMSASQAKRFLTVLTDKSKPGKDKKAKLPLCLIHYAPDHEGVSGSGYVDPRILDLGVRWR